MEITGVHHIGYRVENLDQAVSFYEYAFGGRVLMRGALVGGGGKVAFVMSGQTLVELIEPTDKGPVAGRGQVYDHVGYTVPDIASAIDELRSIGIRMANEAPMVNLAGWKLAFLDRDSALGASIHVTEA